MQQRYNMTFVYFDCTVVFLRCPGTICLVGLSCDSMIYIYPKGMEPICIRPGMDQCQNPPKKTICTAHTLVLVQAG